MIATVTVSFMLNPNCNLFLGNGTGYAELLSYCTCDEETNTPFALCDKRSGICDDGKRKKKLKGTILLLLVFLVLHNHIV